MTPTFYFTVHPKDLSRRRLLPGCSVMLVASAHWKQAKSRFAIHRPPADHVSGWCLDSGGFTAAARWGKYPWTPLEYAEFARTMSREIPLDFVAIMDYACEPNVDRSILATNRDRIKATIRNETACREAAPDLPWLPVLQGDSLEERAYDLELRDKLGMLPTDYAGIGSLCKRGIKSARKTIKFYNDHLPNVRFHGFGLHIQALDDDASFAAVRSWDSYSWNWARGQKELNRPKEYLFNPETDNDWSDFTKRLAQLYWQNTILPRLSQDRQLSLY